MTPCRHWRDDCRCVFADDTPPSCYAHKCVVQVVDHKDVLDPPMRRLWDPTSISSVLARLAPNASLSFRVSRMYTGLDQVEPIYGTQYSVSELSREQASTWRAVSYSASHLHVPAPNRFLPVGQELLPQLDVIPDTEGAQCVVVWLSLFSSAHTLNLLSCLIHSQSW